MFSKLNTRFALEISNKKLWLIPIALGILSILMDLFFFHGQPHNDVSYWIVTAVIIVCAIGFYKGKITGMAVWLDL